jgi:CspA family cold shock protein
VTTYRGVVKFFRAEKGWGGITSPDVPADVWVHYSDIEGDGYKTLEEGQPVEFECVKQQQDSWQYVATRVRALPR